MKTIFVLLLPILILSCSNFERGFLTRVFNDGHEAWIFVVYPSTKNKAVGQLNLDTDDVEKFPKPKDVFSNDDLIKLILETL